MEFRSAIHTNPFARLFIFYLAGIILGSLFKIFQNPFFIFCCVLLTALLFIAFILLSLKPGFHTGLMTGVFACLLLLAAGLLNCCVHNFRTQISKNTDGFKGKVRMIIQEPVSETAKSIKSIGRITGIYTPEGRRKCNQKVLVYFEKDSSAKSLKPGDNLICSVTLRKVPVPLNPGEFNYSRYLASRDVFNQTYIPTAQWNKFSENGSFSLKTLSFNLQKTLIGKYSEIGLNKTLFSILSAITLGYKNDLEPETRQAFSKAGVMHVMALSGFNVAVIAFALNYLLYFTRRIIYGDILKTFIIIIVIWLFAFITGLSPSVTRASVMISLVLAGKTFNRNLNISNILYASAFILLTFSPALVFDISFQLSFAAVSGILVFHPAICKLANFKYKAANKIWQLFSVSCAAQLSTLPVTLFYFHQFPVYFWLTNIFVIPLVSLIICMAGIFLLVSFFHPLMVISGKALALLLNVLYKGIVLTEILPFSLIENIRIDALQLVILVFMVIILALFVWQKRLFFVYALLIMLVLLQAISILKLSEFDRQRILVVSNIRNYSVVNIISGRLNYLLASDDLVIEGASIRRALENFWTDHGVGDGTIIQRNLAAEKNYYFRFGTLYGMIVNHASRETDMKIDVMILTGKVQYDPMLVKKIMPRQIILDSSISAYEAANWIKTCRENKLSCWPVSIYGAYVCDTHKIKDQPLRYLAWR